MNIALIYNLRHVKPSLNSKQAQDEAEFDTQETIDGIQKALEQNGHRVFLIEANLETFGNLRRLKDKVDLIFNYCEGIAGADREAQIPVLAEILQIPYTGPGPLTSAILLNKNRTKEILSFYGLPTPAWKLLRPQDLGQTPLTRLLDRALRNHTSFPLIVKPNCEGSSKGIFNDSLVTTRKDLTRAVKRILKNYEQGALIENYQEGREFTVAMLSDGKNWRALPIIEVRFDELPAHLYPIDSYEVKWIYDSPENKVSPLTCPAKISRPLKAAIEQVCLKACLALNILDYCRIDIRLSKIGLPNILDINHPPGLIPDPAENSRYPRAARQAGLSFPEMLEKIVKSALHRYKKAF